MKAILLLFLFAANVACAETASVASKAINALGIDLLQKSDKPQENFLISPYSIQSAMAMAYAGAEGATRDEMAKVLHFPNDGAEVNRSFAELRKMLDDTVARTIAHSKLPKEDGGDMDPITLTVANRLFGQEGYSFRPEFLTLMKDTHDAPFKPMNFKKDTAGATKEINAWVEKQTHGRLQDLIPSAALNDLTRLVLVNAIYLKAPWADPFSAEATKPQPFRVNGAKKQNVPMMLAKRKFGYAKHSGFQVVAVPYVYELQFLILLPDAIAGLAKLEEKLTPELLDECSQLDRREVILQLPRFKLPAQTMPLSQILKSLGMKTAFQPVEANFDRIAPRTPSDNLSISGIFHMTFLSLDEEGTEAAAATGFELMTIGIGTEKPPRRIAVKVDRPFLFAIQHRSSGACLFLGRVTDPR
jgi:serpin B